jgi:DNA polymerase elongation subunit (family B)
MKTTFIPLDYSNFDFEGRNYAKIIGRNKEGKRICVIDTCPIYLWAILKSDLKKSQIEKLISKIEKIKLDLKGRHTKVEKVELQDKNFLNKPVKALKIFATNYKDLHDIADKLDFKEIEKRRGYDLGFTNHYINNSKLNPLNWHEINGEMLNNSNEFGGIDSSLDVDFCIKLENFKKINQENFQPKTLAYDIETNELKIGEGEIIMLSLVGKNFKKVITWKKHPSSKKVQDYVEYVKDEKELLQRFCESVKEFSPDILVGYFSDGFDMPYLKTRAEKLKTKLNLGIDNSQPKISRGIGPSAKINGIVHVDLLKFIRTAYAQYMKSETLTLNEVAKEFLNQSKIDLKPLEEVSKIKIDWEKFYEYNLQDSVLTLKLFEKFWPDISEFTKTINQPIFDLSRAGLSKYVESYILNNLDKFNEIPERRPGHNEIGERRIRTSVEGAFVFEPKPGLYENIAMFDFSSMHTSIIISHNISKGTLLEKKEKNSYETPEIHLNGEKVKFYFSKNPGFFPELLKELFEKRKHFKEQYKKDPNPITKARSNAFKVLSASVHGYIGFFGARYYSLESSASILGLVRKFNKEAIEKVNKEGYEVIYGDTDSIAFQVKDKTHKQVKEFLKKLNTELPGVMELDLEGFFKRGIWVTKRTGDFGAKKKYALLDGEGKIKIRGFETVRRDWCKLSRDTQSKVIELILKNGDEKKAIEYIKKIIKKIKSRDVDNKDLIIKTQLKKPLSEYKAISPHVIAARKMKEREIPISQGTLIEYYLADLEKGSKSKLVRDKVKLPDEKAHYNIEYYLDRQILPAVENIIQVFGINIEELINKKNQQALGKWM